MGLDAWVRRVFGIFKGGVIDWGFCGVLGLFVKVKRARWWHGVNAL